MLPILEGASLEEDPTLQEQWAALLANAATATDPEQIPPILAATLRELTPFAAAVIQAVAEAVRETTEEVIRKIPLETGPAPPRWGVHMADLSRRLGVTDPSRLDFSVDILVRQNLLEREVGVSRGVHPDDQLKGARLFGGADYPNVMVQLTALGVRLLRACQPPPPL